MIGRKYRWISMLCTAMLMTQLLGWSMGQAAISVTASSASPTAQQQAVEQSQLLPTEPIVSFTGGKARYNPGEQASFELAFEQSMNWQGTLVLEFYSLNKLVGSIEREISVLQAGDSLLDVTWQPPSIDFRGYLVKAYVKEQPQFFKTVAVDVSSNWTHFPRYGYTSEFPQETAEESEAKLKQLSQQYYLNAYQFYDWMWRHDVSVLSEVDENGEPLRDEQGEFITSEITADTVYDDLLGRPLYPLAVKQQVQAAQKYGSAAMAYQMNYAARENYEAFGVKREWGLFNKNTQFPNPDPLMYQNGYFFDWVPSSLYLQDPGNVEWQQYITREYNRSINDFGFDGIHLDQWGASDSDYLYDYYGNERYYSLNYDELINATKQALTENNARKNYVTFNMVGGNQGYSHVPSPATQTDFDYSELWTDKDNYSDLLEVIEDTRSKNGNKAMVIAAYMNYKQATGDIYPVEELEDIAKTVQFHSRINSAYGWVGDFGKKDEDAIIWTVDAPQAGSYQLTLQYGHANSANPVGKLSINGQLLDEQLVFAENTGWGNPVAALTLSAQLNEGSNEIKLQLDSNDLWLNVDSLTVAGEGSATVYEAEYAQLISCKVDQYGNVYYFETEGDYVSFQVETAEEGVYPLQFRYSAAAAAVTRDLFVNGEASAQSISFAPTGGWNAYKNSPIVNVPLQAGSNVIMLKLTGASDRGMKLDYAQVGETRYEAEKAAYGWQPTKEAQIQKFAGTAEGAYIYNLRNAPDSVTFDLVAEEAGMQTIAFQYATSNTPTAELLVNGSKVEDVSFASSGGWGGDGKWSWLTADVAVQSGVNEITLSLTSHGQYLNLDGMIVNGELKTIDSAQLSGGVAIADTGLATSARSDNFNGAADKAASFNFETGQADTYKLGIWYRTGTDHTTGVLAIGEQEYTVELPNNDWYSNNGWGLVELDVQLAAGSNLIVFKLDSESTYINLHALSLGKKLEAEADETRITGVVKGEHWLDDFGSGGDLVSWQAVVAADEAAAADELKFHYRAPEILHYQLIVDGVVETIEFAATEGEWRELAYAVELAAGEHSFQLQPSGNSSASIELAAVAVAGHEPINAPQLTRGGGAALEVVSQEAGYAGEFTQQGDYIRFTTGTVTASAPYELEIAYRNTGETAQRALYVNGKKAGTVEFPATGTDEQWSAATASVYLSAGQTEQSIVLKQELNDTEAVSVDIDYIALDGVKYEAEAAETGWEPVVVKTGGVQTTLGKTDNHGKAGQSVTFNIDTLHAAEELLFRYRSGNSPAFHIFVDGEQIASDVVFGATQGGWDGGMAEKAVQASIPAGSHSVQLVMATDGQYINLDSLIVAGREYEVEDALFAPENHDISITRGYVTEFADENDFLIFQLELEQAATVDLTWGYRKAALSGEAATRSLYVNGEKQGAGIQFPHTSGNWSEMVSGHIQLQAGMNQIMLRLEGRDDEGIELDYVDVGDIRLHAEKADFTPAMVLDKDLLLHFGHAGDEVTFPITVEQAGETSLIFTYANEGASATKALYIDGQPALDDSGKPVTILFQPTANSESFNEDVYYIVPYLSAGEHQITLKHGAKDKGVITLKSMTLGFFDEPSIRLMDAALAAMGATHIEIGTAEKLEEGPNMLAHEYYPNRSKKMKASLKESMGEYYKFFAAYENVLFDSRLRSDSGVTVTDSNGDTLTVSEDGAAETMLVLARDNKQNKGFENYEIIHLVNLLNNDANWRNAAAEPTLQNGLTVRYPMGSSQSQLPDLQVYTASPDRDGGMLQKLDYTWSGTDLLITLPSLHYWEMIVVDKGNAGPGSTDGGSDHSTSEPVPVKANEKLVTRAELTASGDSIAIQLQKEQTALLVALDDLKLLGNKKLTVQAGDMQLGLPASVLQQLVSKHNANNEMTNTANQGDKTSTGDKGRYVAVIIQPASDKVRDELLQSLPATNGGAAASGLTAAAELSPASGLFHVQLGLMVDHSFMPYEGKLDQALLLQLQLAEAADSGLTGLYSFDQSEKQWHYIGSGNIAAGAVANRELLQAEVNEIAADSTFGALMRKISFTDVKEGHWAARAIEVLAARHIIEGKPDGSFDLTGSLTRAEIAALLARAYQLPVAAAEMSMTLFRDVNSTAWYEDSVAAVYQAGWMKGRAGETFAPNEPVTREEMAVIINRILEGGQAQAPASPDAAAVNDVDSTADNDPAYSDADSVAAWATDSVAHVSKAEIMQGYPDGTFAPKREVSRQEAAQILYRLLTQL